MKCPIDKTDSLSQIALIEGLPAMQCSTCGGVWVDSNAYLAWRKASDEIESHASAEIKIDPTWDVNELKLCPNSGHIMGRYKVLADTDLYLDRCGHCNGVWFDKHEWDALIELGLHDNANEFFTRPWQDHIRSAEARNHMEKFYLEKFGAEDYERVKQFREWLKDHPKRGMALAFLQANDPYHV